MGLLGPLGARGSPRDLLPLAEELRRQQALFDDWLGSERSDAGAITQSG